MAGGQSRDPRQRCRTSALHPERYDYISDNSSYKPSSAIRYDPLPVISSDVPELVSFRLPYYLDPNPALAGRHARHCFFVWTSYNRRQLPQSRIHPPTAFFHLAQQVSMLFHKSLPPLTNDPAQDRCDPAV